MMYMNFKIFKISNLEFLEYAAIKWRLGPLRKEKESRIINIQQWTPPITKPSFYDTALKLHQKYFKK